MQMDFLESTQSFELSFAYKFGAKEGCVFILKRTENHTGCHRFLPACRGWGQNSGRRLRTQPGEFQWPRLCLLELQIVDRNQGSAISIAWCPFPKFALSLPTPPTAC